MHIGLSFGFGKGDPAVTDAETYQGETALAVESEGLGFDSVWAVEHHFEDYSFCPDNLLWLAHIAGKTSHIRLGTGAVILPWNNPLRVAEKLLMLDHLSGGRAIFGMGRGLSRREYRAFNIPLDETRERFDEASAMIIQAIETGVIEGDGPYYPQPRTELRPRPLASWQDRLYTVAGSPDSIVSGVANKAGLMSFVTKPVDKLAATFQSYRDQFEERWGEQAPPVAVNVNFYTHEDESVVNERFYEYVGTFYNQNVDHYEFNGTHFATTKGYERYAEGAAALRETGVDQAGRDYADSALSGTPQQVLDKAIWMSEQLGEFVLLMAPAFGGMPYDQAQASLRLFSEQVAPKLRQHVDSLHPVGV
ncbi:LLM class flavin-dependent oxidoreductase [Citricoccus sp. GCM10030269]|uniref:LLM class flavin-dependent oxidoreductase n=1 Tax=Citricoccus sp. GCM10030269 TaxID=3273388 RepID=UPI003618379D